MTATQHLQTQGTQGRSHPVPDFIVVLLELLCMFVLNKIGLYLHQKWCDGEVQEIIKVLLPLPDNFLHHSQ